MKTPQVKMFTKFLIGFNPVNPRNLWFLLFFSISSLFADDFPKRSNTLVTDYTNTLSPEEKNHLENKLVDFNRNTSTQIAIVIMPDVKGYDINDYGAKLGDKWGIGRKGKDNGILILLSKETREVTIQIGYGLEGAAPDAIADRVIRDDMIPYFKQNNFFAGLDKATDTMMSLVKGEFSAKQYVDGGEKFPWYMFVIIFFIIVISIGSTASRARRYARTNNISFWTAWWLFSQMRSKQRGSWGNFSSGRGIFGGGGGGGFGGFGGGSFGGGGASGRW